jgi:hypothetical protein
VAYFFNLVNPRRTFRQYGSTLASDHQIILFLGSESAPALDPYAVNPKVTFDTIYERNPWAAKLHLLPPGKDMPDSDPAPQGWKERWGWNIGRG